MITNKVHTSSLTVNELFNILNEVDKQTLLNGITIEYGKIEDGKKMEITFKGGCKLPLDNLSEVIAQHEKIEEGFKLIGVQSPWTKLNTVFQKTFS